MKQNQSQKTRLKRRIHGYRTLGVSFVFMLETDFRGVFVQMMREKGLNILRGNFGENLNKLIEVCSEKECLELNMKLDCYQIDKKQ